MSQLAREAGKRKKKGRNTPDGVSPSLSPPSISSSTLGSGPSVARGVQLLHNLVLARQQAQEKKYPLWKHGIRKEGLGVKLGGGGNMSWICNFYKNRVQGYLLSS